MLPPEVATDLGRIALRIHQSPNPPIVDIFQSSGGAHSAVDTAFNDFNIHSGEHLILAPFVAMGAAIVGSVAAALREPAPPANLPSSMAPTLDQAEKFRATLKANGIGLEAPSTSTATLAAKYSSVVDLRLQAPTIVGNSGRSRFAVVYSVTTRSLTDAFDPHTSRAEWVSKRAPAKAWIEADGAAVTRELNLLMSSVAVHLLKAAQRSPN